MTMIQALRSPGSAASAIEAMLKDAGYTGDLRTLQANHSSRPGLRFAAKSIVAALIADGKADVAQRIQSELDSMGGQPMRELGQRMIERGAVPIVEIPAPHVGGS